MNFENIIEMKDPKKEFLSLPGISDDMLYEFNRNRYKFYLKFLDGLGNPEILRNFLYTNTQVKIDTEQRKELTDNIAKSLKILYSNIDSKNVDGVSEKITDKIKQALANKLKDNQDSFDIIKKTFDIKSSGGAPEETLKKLKENFTENAPNIMKNFNESIEKIKGDENINLLDQSKLQQLNKLMINNDDNKILDINFNDRLIFIAVTYFIRLISLFLISMALNSNLINNFHFSFIYYCAVYIIFFLFITMIVNVIYYFPIVQLYNDSSITIIPNLLYYFYVYTNGFNRLFLHIILILLLLLVPYIINKDTSGTENNKVNISYNLTLQKHIMDTLSYFTLLIWILTSIIAIKF